MTQFKRILLTGVFVIMFAAFGIAQGPPGGGPPSGGNCIPPPCVPIDGGIGVLLAAGALYGGKKLYQGRK